MINSKSQRIRRIFLLPACAFVLALMSVVWHGSAALTDYYAYTSIYKSKKVEFYEKVRLYRFFLQKRFHQSWMEISLPNPAVNSPLETLYIAIDRNSISALNSNLPISGQENYYRAFMRVGLNGKRYSIKIRYRGDNPYHWLYEKKSLRIKTNKNNLYRGHRKFNLINSKNIFGIQECINYELSKIAGLMAPECYFVRVFINGQYMGVYQFTSQIGESLLRKNKRIPGSIYSGDINLYSSDKNSGEKYYFNPHKRFQTLWRNQNRWKKISSRNSEQKYYREDIKLFVKSISSNNPTHFRKFFDKYMNKKKWLSYMALEVILGGAHHSNVNNFKLYFDPLLGKFEPIQWDFFVWDVPSRELLMYGSQHKLLLQILKQPDLTEELHKRIYQLKNRPEFSHESIFSKLNNLYEKTKYALESDRFKDTYVYLPTYSKFLLSSYYNMSDYERAIDSLKVDYKVLENLSNELLQNTNAVFRTSYSQGLTTLDIVSSGNVGIKINFDAINSFRNYQDSNLNGFFDTGDELILPGIEETILPGKTTVRDETVEYTFGSVRVKNYPLNYRYFLINDKNIQLNSINGSNNITGYDVTILNNPQEYESTLEKRATAKGDNLISLHPWSLPTEPEPRVLMFSGDIDVVQDLEIEEGATVHIAPGTRFLMGPGASILIRGRVKALGTKDNPIEVKPKNEGTQWGVFVVRDEGADGSEFDYFYLRDGSTTMKDMIEYSGMFSIYNVQDVTVDHCRIGRNYDGDDGMHFAYSSGEISNCFFRGAASDALDVDISRVTIRNSVFLEAGNDALDFMTSRALVQDNIFFSTGDKCISVGEATEARIENNLFYDCQIALQVKDNSRVDLESAVIVDARAKAIDLYNKNYRYGRGGTVQSGSIYIPSGVSSVTVDDRSKATIQSIINDYPEEFTLMVLGKPLKIDPQGLWLERIDEFKTPIFF